MKKEDGKKTSKYLYKNGAASLLVGDAVETLNAMPPDSVDMIFADPPYGLSNGGTTCHAGKRVSVNKGEWDRSRGVAGDYDFHSSWINAARRVLKPSGSLWISGSHHSIYACGFALQTGGWHILNEICWYKPNAAPHLACRMFAHSHETLLWARKTKTAKHFFDYALMRDGASPPQDFLKKENRQMRSVWAFNTPPAAEKKYGRHPAQKPLALLERIVMASCPKGGLVLDPFCGSGTTGVAALRGKRKFVGIDSEKKYLEKMAMPRLADAKGGSKSGVK